MVQASGICVYLVVIEFLYKKMYKNSQKFFHKKLDKIQKMYYNKDTKGKEITKMKALNNIEKKVLEMLAEGKPVHGLMRDILIEMQLREMEKED
jgi:hypothetical protein